MPDAVRGALLSAGLAVCAAPAAAQQGRTGGFDCIIEPAATVEVASPTPGLLETVLVDRGDTVTAGQKLARLRSEIEETTVRLMAERAQSRDAVRTQAARVRLSRKELERTKALGARDVASSQEVEEAQASLDVATGELATARMRHRVAQLELERARQRLERRTIRSPIDGTVTERALDDGEYIDREAHVVTVAKLDPLHVEAFLPVELFEQVEEGMTATVRPAPPVEGALEARVEVVDSVFDAASATFGVRLVLPNEEHAIPAGHRCTLRFEVS